MAGWYLLHRYMVNTGGMREARTAEEVADTVLGIWTKSQSSGGKLFKAFHAVVEDKRARDEHESTVRSQRCWRNPANYEVAASHALLVPHLS